MTSTLVNPLTRGLAEVPYQASARVRSAIDALGRTEDVRFSPGGGRLAVVAFTNERLLVFDIAVTSEESGPAVSLTGGVELSCSALKSPHGVDFIDEQTVVVTNRGGDVTMFALPPGAADVPMREVQPLHTWRGGGVELLHAPGSVAVTHLDAGRAEVLICNNDAHTVTRHLVDRADPARHAPSGVLLRKWLDIPDGIGVSRDRRWIAISNHSTREVLLYEWDPALTEDADPQGVLKGVNYPHGVRFSADGRFLFVADAGAPYVQIYASDSGDWRGVHQPAASIPIMGDTLFRQGAQHVDEGGPKGLDLDRAMQVLVATSKFQPLAFFDMRALLALASSADAPHLRRQHAANVAYELRVMAEHRATSLKAAAARHMERSHSWRITAPLRWLYERFPGTRH